MITPYHSEVTEVTEEPNDPVRGVEIVEEGDGSAVPADSQQQIRTITEESPIPPAAIGMEVVPGPAEATGHSPVGVTVTGTVDGVRRWQDTIKRFEICRVAAQVMCGFELSELKRKAGFARGGYRGKPMDDREKTETWEEFVQNAIGLSDETARTYIRMADAVKPRLKKLAHIGDVIDGILSTPITELPAQSVELLFSAVRSVADGKSQFQLMLELGLAKHPQGSAAKGGNLGGTPAGPAPTPDDAAILRAAREDWFLVAQKMRAAGCNFTLLPDAEIEALVSELERLGTEARRWLRATAEERNQNLVATIRQNLNA
jgi:hypothetical protein